MISRKLIGPAILVGIGGLCLTVSLFGNFRWLQGAGMCIGVIGGYWNWRVANEQVRERGLRSRIPSKNESTGRVIGVIGLASAFLCSAIGEVAGPGVGWIAVSAFALAVSLIGFAIMSVAIMTPRSRA